MNFIGRIAKCECAEEKGFVECERVVCTNARRLAKPFFIAEWFTFHFLRKSNSFIIFRLSIISFGKIFQYFFFDIFMLFRFKYKNVKEFFSSRFYKYGIIYLAIS